jgi:chemotaxis protein methyltransferase CheR
MVDFDFHNLVSSAPPPTRGPVDLILCRNVFIYFTAKATRAVLDAFQGTLASDGYLLLGLSERLDAPRESGLTASVVSDVSFYRSASCSRLEAVESAGRPVWQVMAA